MNHRYPLNKRLGVPQRTVYCACRTSNPVPWPPARSPVAIPTPITQLQCSALCSSYYYYSAIAPQPAQGPGLLSSSPPDVPIPLLVSIFLYSAATMSSDIFFPSQSWSSCRSSMEFSIQSLLLVLYSYSFVLYDWPTVIVYCTVDLHLSGLIGTGSHPDMQKIRTIEFFFENRLHWQFEVWLLLFTVCTFV
jgi:hypothetical protein